MSLYLQIVYFVLNAYFKKDTANVFGNVYGS